MSQEPKYHAGQPVIVIPMNGPPAFDAVIVKNAGWQWSDASGSYEGWSYHIDPNPASSDSNPDDPWCESLIFPRNADCKSNGMTWEDIKQSLKCTKLDKVSSDERVK